jgi:23S rRNA (guanosine2251-2'-O)-methyltransferase
MANYIYGKNSVLAVLQANPDRVFKVFLAEGLKPDKRVDAIIDRAQSHGIAWQKVPRPKLDGMLSEVLKENPDTTHQGVVASVAPRPLLDVADLIKKAEAVQAEGQFPLVLMLDGVNDPGNFGAILRVADASGLTGVVVAKHNSVGFGPVVSKTASGADQTVDVAVTPNLVQALEKFKKAGFWVVGSTLAEKSIPYFKQDYAMATVLVMGSEGKGLSRLVQEHCDFLVNIPMMGSVDSLNVATATAVLVFEMRRQQAVPKK